MINREEMLASNLTTIMRKIKIRITIVIICNYIASQGDVKDP